MAATYTASNEALFLPEVNPNDWFEKQASLGKVPEDDKKWPGFVLSELHKQLPFLSDRDVAINMSRIEPEAGFAFGYALIRNARPAEVQPKDERSFIRIPIMITDRQLQPFHVFVLGGKAYPLTKERVQEAMVDPTMFAGSASLPDKQKGLMDELFPPYQQRQGFGRTSESGSGVQKLAEAEGAYAGYPAGTLDPKELARLSKLRRYEGYDAAMRDLSLKERAPVLLSNAAKSTLIGSGLATAHGAIKGGLRGAELAGRAGLGAAVGGASYLGNLAHSTVSRKLRDRDRKQVGMLAKEASDGDIEGYRMAEEPQVSCSTCTHFESAGNSEGFCRKFSAPCAAQMVCDEWKGDKTASILAALWPRT
jgi:hypothetical protein